MDYKLIEKQLDELNLDGYKHIKNNEWELPDQLINWLKEHNFKEIGSGAYSTVFKSETENFVVKVNNELDHGYLDFVYFCQQNKNSPHLPKMGKIKMIESDEEEFYVLFIEKLEKFDPSLYGIDKSDIKYFFDDAINFFKEERFIDDRKEFLDELVSKYEYDSTKIIEISEQLYDCIDLMAIFSLKSGLKYFDLHAGNIMMRGKTLVITDPVV